MNVCRPNEASVVQSEAKGVGQERLVSPVTVGTIEMPYRMIVRESRLTSRLQQCLEATWKQK